MPLAFGLLRKHRESAPSRAASQCLSILHEEDGLLDALQMASQMWQMQGAIHGDLRWDNCAISRGADPRWWILDWELATLGDPAWDVAFLFQSYLSFWVMSTPLGPTDRPSDVFALAGDRLEDVQRQCGDFWSAYARHREIDGQEAADFLERVFRYSALGLLQSAYEHSATRSLISTNTICLLQLCANVARNPREVGAELLGFG